MRTCLGRASCVARDRDTGRIVAGDHEALTVRRRAGAEGAEITPIEHVRHAASHLEAVGVGRDRQTRETESVANVERYSIKKSNGNINRSVESYTTAKGEDSSSISRFKQPSM